MSSPPYRSYVQISRGQIARNYRNVREAVGPGVEALGVVKADAYGHGAIEVSRVLEAEGCKWLAVSSVEEGMALRRSGSGSRILIMAGFLSYEREALVEFNLTPVVHSLEDVANLKAMRIPFHLKVDTGMSRLGTREGASKILAVLASAGGARLEGLMTHFASAADFGSRQTEQQVKNFEAIRKELAEGGCDPLYLHVSSTNAIAYARREGWDNMVRAGHAIYGYVSPARGEAPPKRLSVRPALTWKAKILLVKEVPEGTKIGYGGSYKAHRAMRIGVLALGYADGLPHQLSNKGKVIAAGKPAPILGTVSMDLTTIDLSDAPMLGPGDDVTILGEEGETRQDAQQIASLARTISYNILCGIGARVHRVYVD